MERQGLSHAHRSLHFRVIDTSGERTPYDPDIVVHRGSTLFVLDVLDPTGEGRTRVDLASRFLAQHSSEIVFVAIVPAGRIGETPKEAYDEIFEAGQLLEAVARIREQDPHGFVAPFLKPSPPGEGSGETDRREDG